VTKPLKCIKEQAPLEFVCYLTRALSAPPNFANVNPLAGDMLPTTPDEERLFVGSSAPLFTMYRKFAEDDDKEMAQRWQKDANSILLFVSPQLSKYKLPHYQNVKRGRPVYFLLQLRHWSR
jgi:hypothetical protein